MHREEQLVKSAVEIQQAGRDGTQLQVRLEDVSLEPAVDSTNPQPKKDHQLSFDRHKAVASRMSRLTEAIKAADAADADESQ
ncbi:unnamed protein product [Penicillium bialowiezense]